MKVLFMPNETQIPTPTRIRLLADTFASVLGESDYCAVMRLAADELEAAQKDKARLDWLDGERFEIRGTDPQWRVDAMDDQDRLITIRQAIDAHLDHVPKQSA